MTINERDFRGIDLNLLIVFHVLMRERSVSRAAERLFLGQPAVSAALARLREIFKDELFFRAAGGMEPTSKARHLALGLAPALEALQASLFAPSAFDPATHARTFYLGMRDWVEMWLMPELLTRIQQAAPKVRLAVLASDSHQGTRMLENEEMDLGVSVFPEGPSWQRREPLGAMGYRCVYNGKRLKLRSPLTLKNYMRYPHVVTPPLADFRGVVDDQLADKRKQRNVIYTTPRFAALPQILQRAAVIATVPEEPARRWAEEFDLTNSAAPVPIAPLEIAMIWHAKHEGDAGLHWLRGVIRSIVTGQIAKWRGKHRPVKASPGRST